MSIQPTDLLDEDGNVDHAAVRERSQNGAGGSPNITLDECVEFRRRLLRGETTYEIGEDTGRASQSIGAHARGECSHDEARIGYPTVAHHGHPQRGTWLPNVEGDR